MKKSTLLFWFIAASVAYVVYLRFAGSINVSVPASSVAQSVLPQAPAGQIVDTSSQAQVTSGEPPQNSSQTSATPTQSAPTAQPVSKSKSAGMYTDGTYTGNSADAYYGTVQVQVVVKSGALASVNFLQYPKDRGGNGADDKIDIAELTQKGLGIFLFILCLGFVGRITEQAID